MEITSSQNTLLNVKDSIPFFKALNPTDVLLVTQNVSFTKDLKKGHVIFSQGEYSKEIYLVISGSVAIEAKEEKTKEYKPITKIFKKSMLGEMAFVTGEPRSARAVVNEDNTSVLSFDIVSNPDPKQILIMSNVYLAFAKELSRKLKNSNDKQTAAKLETKIPYDDILEIISKAAGDKDKDTDLSLTIQAQTIQEIDKTLEHVKDEEEKKEIIKVALSDFFKLDSKDLIIMTKNKIILRFFQEDSSLNTIEQSGLIQVQEAPKKITPKEPSPAVVVQKEKSQDEELIEDLTANIDTFMQRVTKEYSPAKFQEKFTHIVKQIVSQSQQRKILNFHFLSSYNEFSITNLLRPLNSEIWEMIRVYLVNDLKKGQVYYDVLLENKNNQASVLKLAKRIFVEYKLQFAKIIARTFFEAVSDLDSNGTGDECLESAISGASRHQSILVDKNNIPIATKLQQVWMRTQQAKKIKEQALKGLKEDYESYSAQTKGFENSIRALYRAKYVSLEDVENWTHETIRDYVINENNEFKEEKRLLQYIPTGEVTDFLRTKSEKGVIAAKSEIGKEEYARTHRFMEVLHSNNTERNLDFKLEELYAEKDKKEKLANSMKENLNLEEQKGLEEYDSVLYKMFEIAAYNLAKTTSK